MSVVMDGASAGVPVRELRGAPVVMAFRMGAPQVKLSDFRCDLPGVLQNTKTPQVWKYEKNTKKLQNRPFPVWPQKYEKITEKFQNWPENDHFCNFSVIFSYFWGPNRKWAIL